MTNHRKNHSAEKNLELVLKQDPQLAFLSSLILLAKKTISPQKIILFGSRARKDHKITSDVDLAFLVAEKDQKSWPRFVTEVEDTIPTLLTLDLVKIDSMTTQEMKESIIKEGVLIYE